MPQKILDLKHIRLEDTVPALRSHRVFEEALKNAHIHSATVHFPDGCNGLVHVTAGHGKKAMLPTNDFLALNDTTTPLPLNEEAPGGEEIWAIIENHDGLNAHHIVLIIDAEYHD